MTKFERNLEIANAIVAKGGMELVVIEYADGKYDVTPSANLSQYLYNASQQDRRVNRYCKIQTDSANSAYPEWFGHGYENATDIEIADFAADCVQELFDEDDKWTSLD